MLILYKWKISKSSKYTSLALRRIHLQENMEVTWAKFSNLTTEKYFSCIWPSVKEQAF